MMRYSSAKHQVDELGPFVRYSDVLETIDNLKRQLAEEKQRSERLERQLSLQASQEQAAILEELMDLLEVDSLDEARGAVMKLLGEIEDYADFLYALAQDMKLFNSRKNR